VLEKFGPYYLQLDGWMDGSLVLSSFGSGQVFLTTVSIQRLLPEIDNYSANQEIPHLL
jgi:hypothetical protein